MDRDGYEMTVVKEMSRQKIKNDNCAMMKRYGSINEGTRKNQEWGKEKEGKGKGEKGKNGIKRDGTGLRGDGK